MVVPLHAESNEHVLFCRGGTAFLNDPSRQSCDAVSCAQNHEQN